MIGLTRKQRELYDFIAARLRADGVAPTIREMQRALGDGSSGHIHDMVRALEERGYIRRLPNRARAIEIVKRIEPDTAAVTLNPEILALTDRYAAAHGLTRDTAANELLRSALEAA